MRETCCWGGVLHMAKAARSDSLVERVDQLADVYGEVLLGLYDELTDQRERTEAVAARADAVLGEARRMVDDLGAVATQARAIETEAGRLTAPTTAPDRDTVARLEALERMTAALEVNVRERGDAASARSETVTTGLDDDARVHVQRAVDA